MNTARINQLAAQLMVAMRSRSPDYEDLKYLVQELEDINVPSGASYSVQSAIDDAIEDIKRRMVTSAPGEQALRKSLKAELGHFIWVNTNLDAHIAANHAYDQLEECRHPKEVDALFAAIDKALEAEYAEAL